MYEVFGHIFGSIEVANRRLGKLGRSMAKQHKAIRSLAFATLCSGVGLLVTTAMLSKLEKEVSSLKDRVEALESLPVDYDTEHPDDFEN